MPMPGAPVLTARDLCVSFGGVRALRRLSLTVPQGAICAIVGPNGAGKTTLLNCVSRLVDAQSGDLRFAGQDLLALRPHEVVEHGIARTFQHVGLIPTLSVIENVALGGYGRSRNRTAKALLLPSRSRAEHVDRAAAILADLGLLPFARRKPQELPFGTLKRVDLARALMAEPRLLLVDEPANGLRQQEVDELSDLILRIGSTSGVGAGLTIVLVEHHMGLVMRVSEQVIVLQSGALLAAGPPAEIAADPAVIEAYLGT